MWCPVKCWIFLGYSGELNVTSNRYTHSIISLICPSICSSQSSIHCCASPNLKASIHIIARSVASLISLRRCLLSSIRYKCRYQPEGDESEWPTSPISVILRREFRASNASELRLGWAFMNCLIIEDRLTGTVSENVGSGLPKVAPI